MIRKRTAFLILFITLSAIVFGFVTLRTDALNRVFKPFFEKKLGEIYQADVRIGIIEGGIWRGYTLRRVRFIWPASSILGSLAATEIHTDLYFLDWFMERGTWRRSLLLRGTSARLQRFLKFQITPFYDYLKEAPEVEGRIRSFRTDYFWVDGDELVLDNLQKQAIQLGTVSVHVTGKSGGLNSGLRIFGMDPHGGFSNKFYLIENFEREGRVGSARFRLADYSLGGLEKFTPHVRIFSGVMDMGGVVEAGRLLEGDISIRNFDFEVGDEEKMHRARINAAVRMEENRILVEQFSVEAEGVNLKVEGAVEDPYEQKLLDLHAEIQLETKGLEIHIRGPLQKPSVEGQFLSMDQHGAPKLFIGFEGIPKRILWKRQDLGIEGLEGKIFGGFGDRDVSAMKEKALGFSGDLHMGVDGIRFRNLEMAFREDQLRMEGNVGPEKTGLVFSFHEFDLGRFLIGGDIGLEINAVDFAQSEDWPVSIRSSGIEINGVHLDDIEARFRYQPVQKKLELELFRIGVGCRISGGIDFQNKTLDILGRFHQFDVRHLFFLAPDPDRIEVEGLLDGEVRVNGPLDHPETVGKLKVLRGSFIGIEFESSFFDLRGSGPVIDLTNSRLVDEGRQTLVTGYLDFARSDPFSQVKFGSDEKSLYFMGLTIESEDDIGEVTFGKELGDRWNISLHAPRDEKDHIGIGADKDAEIELEYEYKKDQNLMLRFGEEEGIMGLKRKYSF